MRAVASRLVHAWLLCGNGPTVGAILRIAYDAGQRTELNAYKKRCVALLHAANRFARLNRANFSTNGAIASAGGPPTGGGSCAIRGYLATDWFVGADPARKATQVQARLAAAANKECWEEQMRKASAPTWLWPADERMMDPIIAGVPELLRPWSNVTSTAPFAAKALFRAYLDLAVLTEVDGCLAAGHMGNLVNMFRNSLGRKPCENA